MVVQGDCKFYISTVYGWKKGVDKRRLWAHLGSLKSSLTKFPWILVGDFNVIVHMSENSNYIDSQAMTLNVKEFT